MTDWLTRLARRAGWPWVRQPVHPGRDNVIALIRGDDDRTILWESHQDTVAVDGMTVAPFAAEVREGRLYGRGSCDVKGSMAAMLAALLTVSGESPSGRPSILFAATVNEECGFTGARALAEVWRAGGPSAIELAGDGGLTLAELRRRRPGAAIVAEPTELDVVVAHRGVVRWQCVVHGQAAHSSRPECGANAVYAMTSVVRAIEEFHRVVLASRPPDPLCGPSTACVTTFHGGLGANTVPDRAVIDVDRRLIPGESTEAAYEELCAYVAERAEPGGCRIEHERPWMESGGLAGVGNGAWAEAVAAVVQSSGRASRLRGVPYGTNAASISAAGIPTVVLGPGSIDQAHTADEWIAIAELEAATEVFKSLARGAATPTA